MNLNRLGTIIGIAASSIGIVGAIGGAFTYIYSLDNRIGSLQSQVQTLGTQVHTLTVAPTLAQAGGSSTPNPIANACAELAIKAVEARSVGKLAARDEANKRSEYLGCGDSTKK